MFNIMSHGIKGYIRGKEIILRKKDLEKCFFCDKFVVPKDFLWQKTSFSLYKEWLGEIPNDTAGKIGNKTICKDCIGDLEMLLPFKYYDDDD